jgi:hypothetical protein
MTMQRLSVNLARHASFLLTLLAVINSTVAPGAGVPRVTLMLADPPARILSREFKRVTLRGKCHYFP